jgi:phosphoribosylformylglycinamidine (FGAM) synthase-like enzyme
MKYKVSDRTSLIALIGATAATVGGSILLAFESQQGSKIEDNLRDEKDRFTLIKLDPPKKEE